MKSEEANAKHVIKERQASELGLKRESLITVKGKRANANKKM
jgi:hypothetical protein